METGSARKYRGLVQLLACMPREEGLAALWKGERCDTRLVDDLTLTKHNHTHTSNEARLTAPAVCQLCPGHVPAQLLSVTYGVASFAVFESLAASLNTLPAVEGNPQYK